MKVYKKQMTFNITVVVIYHNEQRNLPGLLDSFEGLKGTGLESRIPFLFIDNNSVDDSSEIIKKWINSNFWVTANILTRGKNHIAEARQQALCGVQTPWLAFIDADSRLVPGWFEKVIQSINDGNPETAVIGGESSYLVERNWHSFIVKLARYFPMGKKGDKKTEIFHVPTNNYLLKKEAGLKVGGFDSFFNRVGEDLDINVRLRRKYRIFYDPRFSIKHRSPSSIFNWYSKMALYGRAQSFVLIKYFGQVPWKKFLPGVMIPLFLVFVYHFPGSLILLVFFFLIPGFGFYFLSLIFYGLGEWVGLALALSMILRRTANNGNNN